MCVGKALTGGTLTLAAALCTPAVAAAIGAGEGGALMHGPTFMGNPLACAAALASTDLLLDGSLARAGGHGSKRELRAGARARPRRSPGVADVRVLGAIGVVQLERPVDVAAATEAALAEGVWLRPFRDLVYTMPPFVSTPEEVAAIGRAVLAASACELIAPRVARDRAGASPRRHRRRFRAPARPGARSAPMRVRIVRRRAPGRRGSSRCAPRRPAARSRGRIVSSASHASGPAITVARWPSSASPISHEAESHSSEGEWSTA